MTVSSNEQRDLRADDIGDHPGTGWKLRFWCILTGQGFSLVGSALTQFVLLWWITDTTGSVSALATAGMAALLPQALIGPFGGVLADRYSRRMLMIAADTTSALCMLVLIGLFLTGSVELWHAYVMMAIRSAMQGIQQPSAAASTAMLVPRQFLPRAAGLDRMFASLTIVGAAPLGALAIGFLPIGLPNSEEERKQAGMDDIDLVQAVDYYRTPRGQNECAPNRLRFTSLGSVLAFDAFHLVEELLLIQPIQIITGDVAGGFGSMQDGKDLFDRVKSEKDHFVVEGATHYDLYDRPEPVAKAVAKLVPFYKKHLGA